MHLLNPLLPRSRARSAFGRPGSLHGLAPDSAGGAGPRSLWQLPLQVSGRQRSQQFQTRPVQQTPIRNSACSPPVWRAAFACQMSIVGTAWSAPAPCCPLLICLSSTATSTISETSLARWSTSSSVTCSGRITACVCGKASIPTKFGVGGMNVQALREKPLRSARPERHELRISFCLIYLDPEWALSA